MGNYLRAPTSDYIIYVRTGDRKNVGTDANISIILHDENGHCSDEIVLDNFLRNDFERGALDKFRLPKAKLRPLTRFGRISKIELWRDDFGLGPDWFVDKVVVENQRTNANFIFPIFRWIRPNFHYLVNHLDTSLPQFDEHIEQRATELEEKRAIYVLCEKAPGLPAQVTSIK